MVISSYLFEGYIHIPFINFIKGDKLNGRYEVQLPDRYSLTGIPGGDIKVELYAGVAMLWKRTEVDPGQDLRPYKPAG